MIFRLVVIFIILAFCAKSQDKVFLVNGKSQNGLVISIGQSFVFFRLTDTSATEKLPINTIVLVEKQNGTRYLFSQENKGAHSNTSDSILGNRNNFGAQPVGLLLGRATLVYERLSRDGKIGLVLPVSLTFDPQFLIYGASLDTSQTTIQPISGIGIIGGVDINFYVGKKEKRKFFIGPRIRFGTNKFIEEITGYSVQTQFGWRLSKAEKKRVQHFSIGFGFVRVLSSSAGAAINPKQSSAWFSANYRIGFKW